MDMDFILPISIPTDVKEFDDNTVIIKYYNSKYRRDGNIEDGTLKFYEKSKARNRLQRENDNKLLEETYNTKKNVNVLIVPDGYYLYDTYKFTDFKNGVYNLTPI